MMDFVAFLKSPVNMSHKHLSNSAKVIIVVVVNISIQFSPRLEFKEFEMFHYYLFYFIVIF